MADYAITAAEVSIVGSAIAKSATAGVAIAAGQTIYIDTADLNKAKLADANGTGLLHVCAGIAVNNAAAGQIVNYVDSGELTLDTASITGAIAGDIVILSATPGGMAPHGDLATGWYSNILGHWGSTALTLVISLVRSAVPRP